MCRAAAAFLGADGAVVVDNAAHTVELSKLFLWYGVDFGDTDKKILASVAAFVRRQVSSETKLLNL